MGRDDQVLFHEHGPVLEVCLNRPSKLNAITPTMADRLLEGVTTLADSADLRVMVITGNGRYFSAGMDLEGIGRPRQSNSGVALRRDYRVKHLIWDEFEAVEKPIIAAHHAPCLGGALELSLSCDFRLAAVSARYSLPEVGLGVIPGSGGISRLTRLVGPGWARWLAMAGQEVDARQALTIGLVQAVYPDGEFRERVLEFAAHLSSAPAEAVGVAKLAIDAVDATDRATARSVERLANTTLKQSAQHRALVREHHNALGGDEQGRDR